MIKRLSKSKNRRLAKSKIAPSSIHQKSSSLIGLTGTTLTKINAIGFVLIGDKKYEGLTELFSIPKGVKVRVIGKHSNQLLIEPI